MHICQSCGRIIDSPELFGTHGDGHRNEDYCINCFKNGVFSCSSEVVQPAGLKRWMKDEDKASWEGNRYICRHCGNNMHADTNAAINIRDNYITLVQKHGQAAVNQPHGWGAQADRKRSLWRKHSRPSLQACLKVVDISYTAVSKQLIRLARKIRIRRFNNDKN